MIDMKKTYTCAGDKVRLLCVDYKDCRPVVGIIETSENSILTQWTAEGQYSKQGPGKYDLKEVPPYADYKIDEPVMVCYGGSWLRRHFAGVKKGLPTFYTQGATSWSTYNSDREIATADDMRRPTPEELVGK